MVNITVGNPIGGSVQGGEIVIASEAEGDILYRNATEWVRLAKGTESQVLKMNSGATAPEWGVAGGAWVLESTKTISASTSEEWASLTARKMWALVINVCNDANSACTQKVTVNGITGSAYRYTNINTAGTTGESTGQAAWQVANSDAVELSGVMFISGNALTAGDGSERIAMRSCLWGCNTNNRALGGWCDTSPSDVSSIKIEFSAASSGTASLYYINET